MKIFHNIVYRTLNSATKFIITQLKEKAMSKLWYEEPDIVLNALCGLMQKASKKLNRERAVEKTIHTICSHLSPEQIQDITGKLLIASFCETETAKKKEAKRKTKT
jgi:hypothetical protein